MSRVPVTLHPYFKAHPGQLAAAQALLPRFVAQAASEPGVLYYDFTVNGDEIFCREAYEDAAATLAHLENVGELLKEMLTHCALQRLEFHGPADELEKLHGPARHLNPVWFVQACGLERR